MTPAMFHIVVALAAGELHGYAIMREVAAVSGGAVRLGPATLYRTLSHMLATGLIAEAGVQEDGDERRRTYRLTPAGTRAGRAEARRLAELVAAARRCKLIPQGGR
jgi:DNA-binding PadR family transcriptional regulator